MVRLLTLLIALACVAVGATFSYYNPQPVEVDWLVRQIQVPLGLLLLGAMLCGFLLAMLVLMPVWWFLRIRVARLQKSLLRQSGELDSLRALSDGTVSRN